MQTHVPRGSHKGVFVSTTRSLAVLNKDRSSLVTRVGAHATPRDGRHAQQRVVVDYGRRPRRATDERLPHARRRAQRRQMALLCFIIPFFFPMRSLVGASSYCATAGTVRACRPPFEDGKESRGLRGAPGCDTTLLQMSRGPSRLVRTTQRKGASA